MIFDIQRGSLVDGPGVRTAVFFKGCNLRCAWCHNPEGLLPQKQMMHFENKCIECGKCEKICSKLHTECDFCGKCVTFCPQNAREIAGKEFSVNEILEIILKDKDYYGKDGGVTFSGGECMLQIELLKSLLIECKKNGVNTAVDTAGHLPFSYFEEILPYTDIFLYDLKCLDNEIHKKYVGVDNSLILDNLKRLLSTKTRIWIRIPLIEGVNASLEHMKKVRGFFDKYGHPEKIELLPYHAMGLHKYEALGLNAPEFLAPSKEQITILRNLLT